jgi:hypothetical protein
MTLKVRCIHPNNFTTIIAVTLITFGYVYILNNGSNSHKKKGSYIKLHLDDGGSMALRNICILP